jgi:hypothetical protein
MALAYATDLATGHSRDFALRSCVLAMRFSDVADLDEATRRAVYHQALLRYIGCNADTHLLAAAWGDEITLRRELHGIDMGDKAEFAGIFIRAIKRTFTDLPPAELAKAVDRGLAEAAQVNVPVLSGHCEVAQRLAERLGLPRTLGRPRLAARTVGPRGEISGAAGDAGAGCDHVDRAPRSGRHEGADRQARRRPL